MCLLFIHAALAELIRDCTRHTTQGQFQLIKFTSFSSYVFGITDSVSLIDLGKFTLAPLLTCYFCKNKVIMFFCILILSSVLQRTYPYATVSY